MASDKKKRKQAKLARERVRGRLPGGVHPDGDRRHRGAMREAKKAIKQLEALRPIGAVVLPEEPPEPRDQE